LNIFDIKTNIGNIVTKDKIIHSTSKDYICSTPCEDGVILTNSNDDVITGNSSSSINLTCIFPVITTKIDLICLRIFASISRAFDA
jgi:hypothetical protein